MHKTNMICNCDICKRQHNEEQCIRRICSLFSWCYDRAPSNDASNYLEVMHNPWEYVALTHEREYIRCWSLTYGSGSCQWFTFKEFLKWLSLVDYFVPIAFNSIEYAGEAMTPIAHIRNPFSGKYMSSIDEVNIFLDMLV